VGKSTRGFSLTDNFFTSMFTPASSSGYRDALPGIKFKTLTHGAKTLFTEFHLKRGAVLPRHSHSHEQTGYLLSGSIRLTIGDQSFEAKPGGLLVHRRRSRAHGNHPRGLGRDRSVFACEDGISARDRTGLRREKRVRPRDTTPADRQKTRLTFGLRASRKAGRRRRKAH